MFCEYVCVLCSVCVRDGSAGALAPHAQMLHVRVKDTTSARDDGEHGLRLRRSVLDMNWHASAHAETRTRVLK